MRFYHGAFSPDGTRILTASADKTAKLWDVASGKLIASFDHQDSVKNAAFKSRRYSDSNGKRGSYRQALGCGAAFEVDRNQHDLGQAYSLL